MLIYNVSLTTKTFLIYINIQTWRDEDEKKDASSGPSWFRGHRWVRDSKPNGFRTHEFYYDNFKSKGTLLYLYFSLMNKSESFSCFALEPNSGY
jgi:hypothetical protein